MMNAVRHSRTIVEWDTWHRERRTSAIERVRGVIAGRGLAGVVLTRPGTVSWAGGAINPQIDRTASEDVVWIAIAPERVTVITTTVERDRVQAELLPPGVELVAVPWWDPQSLVTAAVEALGAPAAEIGGDGHPGFGVDLGHELAVARLPLSDAEQQELRALGADAAAAVESALWRWRPGVRDTDIAADIVRQIEAAGGDAPVVIVGADERVQHFRHPLALGAPTAKLVMAVLVARRHGLHVALTRYAAAGPTNQLDAQLAAVRQIHRRTLAAARPGQTFGQLYESLAVAYAEAGHANAWEQHYQGGPIGYGQREFELAPCQTDSPWWSVPIAAGTAIAINPSLPGGAKDEDTFLITDDGVELITTTNDWPAADDLSPRRPAILRFGGAA
jgi:Xaa-Pro dipeptidase